MERTGLYRLPDEISFPCPGRRQSPIPAALVVLLGCTARWYPGPARLYCETAWGTRPGCFNWQEAVYTPGGAGAGVRSAPWFHREQREADWVLLSHSHAPTCDTAPQSPPSHQAQP